MSLGRAIVVMLAVALTATQTVAHHPEPDHGLNETTFDPLWSGDEDSTNISELPRDENASAVSVLASGTDVPFNDPPAAVEKWNSGDHQDFPETTANTSVHPLDATLQNGTFLSDAYVEVFAVQPSTKAQLTPTAKPLYVASAGSVLGIIDYRVTLPENESTRSQRSSWTLIDHQINETELLVDDEVVDSVSGNQTPTLEYTDLEGVFGREYALTLESNISVRVENHIATCTGNSSAGNCTSWSESATVETEQLTVRDSITVLSYDLHAQGIRAEYPNGDLGVVLFRAQPWLGYSLPGGEVHGVWRFYSARNEDWDVLRERTTNDSARVHSPLHPLQVFAYPIETGPTATPRGSVSILDTYGLTRTPPILPEDIHLDVLTDPYVSSYGIATRAEVPEGESSPIVVHGLVRGVSREIGEGDLLEVPINQSELTLSVIDQTDERVTVEVQLRDEQTGEPINTDTRGGYVILAGNTVETSGNGTVRKSLSKPVSGVSARFEPAAWWLNPPGYTGDSDVVYVRGTIIDLLRAFYEIGVPVSLLLFGAFVIDRFTGWDLWPPWRRM